MNKPEIVLNIYVNSFKTIKLYFSNFSFKRRNNLIKKEIFCLIIIFNAKGYYNYNFKTIMCIYFSVQNFYVYLYIIMCNYLKKKQKIYNKM